MKYIVVTKKGICPNDFALLLAGSGIEVITDYTGLPEHFLVEMPSNKAAVVSTLPQVEHVLLAEEEARLIEPVHSMGMFNASANWGLVRIDQRAWNPMQWRAAMDLPFNPTRTGKGVDIYVVDSGVRQTHEDLRGRVSVVYDGYNAAYSANYGRDVNGHGTHVASTAAGTKFGVAKEAQIIVAKVFDGASGTIEAVVGGINACVNHHMTKIANGVNRPSVMNLSLGGGAHPAIEAAVKRAINAGIVVVAAAGNDGRDLGGMGYDVMPAEIVHAITVGSTNVLDCQSPFSNYGSMVDLYAPGQDIVAASHMSDNGTATLSGTSMATPHVAGVVALHLQGTQIMKTAAEVLAVHDWVWQNATKEVVSIPQHSRHTPNRLLFANYVEPQPFGVHAIGDELKAVEGKLDVIEGEVKAAMPLLKRIVAFIKSLKALWAKTK